MSKSSSNSFPIALLSDFGYRDHYVGVMKGVIATIAPNARLLDITHGIPSQSVVAGAIALRESWRYFPPRTIFVAVVDPGVGSARRPIAIETEAGARFIAPDNGLLSLALKQAGIRRTVELTSTRHRLARVSATFHGRDVFAPAAAHLWNGVRLTTLGPAADGIEQLDLGRAIEQGRELSGVVVYVDGFGNMITNIDRPSLERFAARFPGRGLLVKIRRGASLQIHRTYSDAARGAPLATFGSFGLLEIAVREGSAAGRFNAGPGMRVKVCVSR